MLRKYVIIMTQAWDKGKIYDNIYSRFFLPSLKFTIILYLS